jgi:hypothetical protein
MASSPFLASTTSYPPERASFERYADQQIVLGHENAAMAGFHSTIRLNPETIYTDSLEAYQEYPESIAIDVSAPFTPPAPSPARALAAQ